MKRNKLIWEGLRYYWRSHAGVVLGAAVGTAALAGALMVGDSVRESLRQRALERLGAIRHAWTAGDRMVEQELAQRLAAATKANVHPVLVLPGAAAREDGAARANQVNIHGVSPEFFSSGAGARAIPPGEVLLNEPLATQLNVKPGDLVILRLRKPGALSADATIAPQAESMTALRVRVAGVLNAGELGNFSLRANQLPPLNAFLNLPDLASAAGAIGRANLLVSDSPDTAIAQASVPLTLQDLQLELRQTNGFVELRTERVFLDRPILDAATNSGGLPQAKPILTYVANLLQAGTNSTPYSMVAAAGPPWTPADLRDDEVVINQWLADDLALRAGDSLSLTYFVADSTAELIERTNTFRVREVVPMQGVHGDRTLMPEFPGIAKAESTHDWDAGFPLVHKIRPKDDQYWKEFRGTPKAFISVSAGQALWANRFGNATALRWPAADIASGRALMAQVQSNLLHHLEPAAVGIQHIPVREQALLAASQSQDFGGLFIGFSLFLIVAALILMGLLFQFGVEQRVREIGTLLALGFTPKTVRRLWLLEGAALAFIGSVIGLAVAIVYARLMLHGLTTVWRSATNTGTLVFHLTPTTIAAGLVSGVLVALLTIWLVLRKQARQPARELLAGDVEPAPSGGAISRRFRLRPSPRIVAVAAGVGALGLLVSGFARTGQLNPGQFFGAGALLLICGIACSSAVLRRTLQSSPQRVTSRNLAVRGAARRRSRSMATIALLACGVFLITAIGAFRLDAQRDAERPESGTGGFTLIGQSTLPIVKDLSTKDGREALGLDEGLFANVQIVPFRVREGDDASCLNLNRAQRPRLLGVDPGRLQGRFTFGAKAKAIDATGWAMLEPGALAKQSTDEIAAIGDAASIQWALGKKIGEQLELPDERGNRLALSLVGGVANSILQGSLIVSEQELASRFPSATGYRMFLIDCPSNAMAAVSAELSRALEDYGFEVTPAAARLEAFNAVQNTYLSTFQVLGGLGLLLGSAGLGIVVLRNVLERRGELALLLAVGYRPARIKRLVLGEHAALLGAGLLIGVAAAVLAVLPALVSRAELPIGSLAVTLAGVALFGLASTWLATRSAVRANLLEGLRNE